MSKVYTYLIVMITLILGLSAVGLINGATYELLNNLGVIASPESVTETNYTSFTEPTGGGFQVSDLFKSLLDVAGLFTVILGVGGIVTGYVTNRDWVSAVRFGVAGGLMAWVSADMWAFYQRLNNLLGSEFLPFIVGTKILLIILYLGFIFSAILFAAGSE